jgi:hypothetical protein
MRLTSGRFTRTTTAGSGPWTGFTGTWLSSTGGDGGYIANFALESQIALPTHCNLSSITMTVAASTTSTTASVGDERDNGSGMDEVATTTMEATGQ